MYHVISLIVVLISISNRLSAQTYEDADCNGEICFLVRDSPDIECTPMAVSNSPYVIPTPPTGGGDPVWSAVAVNPIDGQIYVLFAEDGAGATVYLGTIEDPYSDIVPFIITVIGDALATEQYTALTFDCEGNAYGVTSGRDPTIIQLDLATGTEIATVDALNESYSTCHPFVECRELIMYNYDTDEFIRISTDDDLVDQRLYVRSSIGGPDDPLNGTLIDYNGVCDAAADITTATYIGNGIALVYCGGSTDNPAILDMTDINNPILRAEAFDVGQTDALLAFNADGSVCKPPSCTTTPTTSPPTTSPSTPSPVMGGYSSDSESDMESDSDRGSDSDSDSSGLMATRRPRSGNGNGNRNRNGNGSGSGSGSGDGAEMFQNAADMGYADENEENMSDLITVDVSDKTVLHFWGLFAVFSVVNIVGCWCIFKRDTKKLKFVTPTPPPIDL